MKKSVIIISVIFLILITSIMVFFVYKQDDDIGVKLNYIAVFKGENGQVVHTTYLYKKKKNKKITYNYINTRSTFSGYDSSAWDEEVIKKGKLKRKKDIFKIIDKNNANSYVKIIKEDKVYSIEEFKEIWK